MFIVQCCFTFTETIRTVRDGEPRTSTSTVTQLLSSETLQFQFSVALHPRKPYGLLGTGSPGRPTSTLTQLLSSEILQFQFSVALRSQRPYGLLETSTLTVTRLLSSESSILSFVQCCFTSTETVRTGRDGEPRTASSTVTQS